VTFDLCDLRCSDTSLQGIISIVGRRRVALTLCTEALDLTATPKSKLSTIRR